MILRQTLHLGDVFPRIAEHAATAWNAARPHRHNMPESRTDPSLIFALALGGKLAPPGAHGKGKQ